MSVEEITTELNYNLYIVVYYKRWLQNQTYDLK